MKKYKIAYVCVHNSCRSQMAEALTKLYHHDFFEAYSAGTETKPKINQDAVRVIKKLHHYDMNLHQSSKLLEALPNEVDLLITMGCNVECPYIPCKHREDWGLDDPSGLKEEVFIETAELILQKIADLRKRIENENIDMN